MIPLIKSTFYQEEKIKKKIIEFIKKTKKISFGKQCEKFEKKFALYQGRKHCVYVNSGSSANLALIQALLNLGRLKKGDKVAFSSLTWSTSVMPIIQLGLKAVPVDVELNTLNVSSSKLQKVLKKEKIKAFFLTNALGFCSDIDQIRKICKKNKIIFLEDNCESLGTVYKGKKLGNYGFASTFSFYVGHHLSTIEGGAICTDDARLADMLKIVRAHGWDRNLEFSNQSDLRKKFKINSTFYSRYTFYDLGFNLRPTEINGYIGLLEMEYVDEILNKRNKNFKKIAAAIYKNSNYLPIKYDHIDFVSNFAIPVICKTSKIRDDLVRRFDRHLEIRPIIGGDVTQQPFFRKHLKVKEKQKTNAKIVHEQGFYFGNNPELSQKEIDKIIKLLSAH